MPPSRYRGRRMKGSGRGERTRGREGREGKWEGKGGKRKRGRGFSLPYLLGGGLDATVIYRIVPFQMTSVALKLDFKVTVLL